VIYEGTWVRGDNAEIGLGMATDGIGRGYGRSLRKPPDPAGTVRKQKGAV